MATNGSSTAISKKKRSATHIHQAIALHTRIAGGRPLGFYQGRCSENTLDIAMEEGGFLYSADSYADELPYWVEGPHGPQLIVPYTLDANDMRFATPQGFNSGDQFFAYLKDSFDMLYAEGGIAPKDVVRRPPLPPRRTPRPRRSPRPLPRLCEIPRSGLGRDPPRHRAPLDQDPSPKRRLQTKPNMPSALFVERFGDIFEHTPEIAGTAHRAGLTTSHDTAQGLHALMAKTMNALSADRKLALIKAHPDLAGRLALSNKLTEDSTREQGSVGLDRLTPAELARFTDLNTRYMDRFGFPFIFAVKGKSKDDILASFETRITNDRDTEFKAALDQIERIAMLRLIDRFPV